MIVCYAAGGGLGHVTRVRAFLHTAHPGRPAVILASSRGASDPRITGPHRTVHPPDGADPGPWFVAALADLAPDELVVDAFPAGLYGELTAAAVPRSVRTVTHLARLLRWPEYRAVAGPPPRVDRTWCVEPLGPEHHADLAAASGEIGHLDLAEPDPDSRPDPDGLADGAWLIVHSGPDAEIVELVGYAMQTADVEDVRPAFVLVSPRRPPALPSAVRHVDVYPAWPLFARAARVVTAAGCNVVRQAAPWRERHRMVPFARRFDDQFARAARARSADALEGGDP